MSEYVQISISINWSNVRILTTITTIGTHGGEDRENVEAGKE